MAPLDQKHPSLLFPIPHGDRSQCTPTSLQLKSWLAWDQLQPQCLAQLSWRWLAEGLLSWLWFRAGTRKRHFSSLIIVGINDPSSIWADWMWNYRVGVQTLVQPIRRRGTCVSSEQSDFCSEQVFNSSLKMSGLISGPGKTTAVSPCVSSNSTVRAEPALKLWHE